MSTKLCGGDADRDALGVAVRDKGKVAVKGEAIVERLVGCDTPPTTGKFKDALMCLNLGEVPETASINKPKTVTDLPEKHEAIGVIRFASLIDQGLGLIFTEVDGWMVKPTIEREGRGEGSGEIFVEKVDERDPPQLAAHTMPAFVGRLGQSNRAKNATFESGDLA